MQHFFDIDFATEFGLNEAIIANNLWYWIKKNEANEKHFHEGKYWTYNSVKALKKIFPYLSERQINKALLNLVDKGIIVRGNFNFSTYDRTLWYAFSPLGNTIMQKCKMDYAKMSNAFYKSAEPIPNNITTNNNSNNKKKIFKKPTIEEVKNYIQEKSLNVIAEAFIDYYDSNGWKVGKNQMKDWKATIRGWARREVKSSYQRKEKEPEWYGKQISEVQATEEEMQELEKRIKSL